MSHESNNFDWLEIYKGYQRLSFSGLFLIRLRLCLSSSCKRSNHICKIGFNVMCWPIRCNQEMTSTKNVKESVMIVWGENSNMI